MARKSIADISRYNYKIKINHLIKWLKINRPSAINEEDEIIMPLKGEDYEGYMGSLMDPARQLSAADADVTAIPKAAKKATLEGVRAAIINLFKENNVRCGPTFDFLILILFIFTTIFIFFWF